jgi:alkylated DNA nucleotide flippase Atl1
LALAQHGDENSDYGAEVVREAPAGGVPTYRDERRGAGVSQATRAMSANHEHQRPGGKCSRRIDGLDEYRQIANRPSGTSERDREREFTQAERWNSDCSEVAQKVRLSKRDPRSGQTCRIDKLKTDLIQKQRRG